MNELIKVVEKDGKQLVSARVLHEFLEVKNHFTQWFDDNKKMFEENVDYEAVKVKVNTYNGVGSTIKKDYACTLDMGKELAMMSKVEKGKQVRKYFIEIEKKATKPMSTLDLMAYSVKLLQEQELKLKSIENRIETIETQPQINAPVQQFSIMGHCRNIGKQVSMSEAQKYGLKCSKMCRDLGLMTGTVPDQRFGKVKTYPIDVLNDIIK